MGINQLVGFLGVVLVAWLTVKLISTPTAKFDPERHIFNKNVIVTGASSGIGREMAMLFCEMGANVFITARREGLLKEVVSQCKQKGRKAAKIGYVVADMHDMEEAANVVVEAVKTLGGIDYLMLNHARIESTPTFYQFSDDGFDKLREIMDVNFFAFVKLTQKAMPHLLRSNGRVGIVSSISGGVSFPLLTEYCTSKSALNGFFGALDLDFYTRNINVSTTVAVIGYIDTDALENYFRGMGNLGRRELAESVTQAFSPNDCAYNIIRSTALKEPVMYFPNTFSIWGIDIMKTLFYADFRDSTKAMFV